MAKAPYWLEPDTYSRALFERLPSEAYRKGRAERDTYPLRVEPGSMYVLRTESPGRIREYTENFIECERVKGRIRKSGGSPDTSLLAAFGGTLPEHTLAYNLPAALTYVAGWRFVPGVIIASELLNLRPLKAEIEEWADSFVAECDAVHLTCHMLSKRYAKTYDLRPIQIPLAERFAAKWRDVSLFLGGHHLLAEDLPREQTKAAFSALSDVLKTPS